LHDSGSDSDTREMTLSKFELAVKMAIVLEIYEFVVYKILLGLGFWMIGCCWLVGGLDSEYLKIVVYVCMYLI